MKKKDEGNDRLTLANVAGGGVERQFQKALARVLDSYVPGKEDPKVRKVTILLSFTRDDEVLSVEAEVNTKIPAFRRIQGMAEIGEDGKVVNLTPPKQADLFDGDEAGEDDGVTRLPASR